jgi:hypothetical protein
MGVAALHERDDEVPSQIAVALLGDRPELLLPPVESLSRHQPNPSCKIASRRKAVGSDRVATIAVAPMTPMSMVSSRLLASFARFAPGCARRGSRRRERLNLK